MRLKDYQRETLETLSKYLNRYDEAREKYWAVAGALQAQDEATKASLLAGVEPAATAWKWAREYGEAASPDEWRSLKDGLDREIPHICLELPTGAGKTLIASHAVGRILTGMDKAMTGFVLWVVPSDAIYRQTLKKLKDRGNPIRVALETASGGRVKILEKKDSFTKADVDNQLCVMLLMLQAAGRTNKETLKVFRDSGKFQSFFPEADDLTALEALRVRVPNLDGFDLSDAADDREANAGIKQSLGNVLRLVRPVIILDEGHKTYTPTQRGTLAGFNPRFLLELTATPDRRHSNILVNINGQRLKDEEMIKLPIQLVADENADWRDTLEAAVKRLRDLQKDANKLLSASGRYIRPILLARVERTGKDQRDGVHIHTEDVFEELTQKLNVPAEWIRRQTATEKELKDDDLSSESCPVRVIITKDALREGWDCPFAYVLALLSRTQAPTALTQMIGRVMRQPQVSWTSEPALNRAHVFCHDVSVRDAVARIKAGLEQEGMGDLAGAVITDGGAVEVERFEVPRRERFRARPIMVPRVTHKDHEGGWRELDFDADILGEIDWQGLTYDGANELPLTAEGAGRAAALIDIADSEEFEVERKGSVERSALAERIDLPDLARRLGGVIPNPWVAMELVRSAVETLLKRAKGDESVVAKVRLNLVASMHKELKDKVEADARAIFDRKIADGTIQFRLRALEWRGLNWEIPQQVPFSMAASEKWLQDDHGDLVQLTLFERVPAKEFNGFEQKVALHLDKKSDVIGWWWRIVARRDWGLQGWRRHKVYPDFLVQLDDDSKSAQLLVLETKGKQLLNEDTEYKQAFFDALESAYAAGKDIGEVELVNDAPGAMRFRILVQDEDWKPKTEAAVVD